MGYTIAICGKGGTGKTTIASLIIKFLTRQKQGSVLAVDADPNSNLNEALGVTVAGSIVSIIDDIAKNPSQIPTGVSKDRFIEYRIQDMLTESDGFDLLAMGRPEGPGCYCYANSILRMLIEKLSNSYRYVAIDNAAGMEHLSRRTTRKIDCLLIVSDYTIVGIRSAKKIYDLARELEISVKDAYLLINRKDDQIQDALNEEIDKTKIKVAGFIPEDRDILECSITAKSVFNLQDDNPAVRAVDKICSEILPAWAADRQN